MELQVTESSDNREISIRDLLNIVKKRGVLVMCFTLIGGLAAGIAAFIVPKQYEASIVLSPVSSTSGGLIGSAASQLGGLAALAGISVGSDSKKSESVAFLQSNGLAIRYIQNNNLLPILYAKKWNVALKNWKKPDDPPTVWKGAQYLKKDLRKVATDAKTGIVTLTIRWTDPALAAEWANGLVRMANDHLRNRAIEESERNISYLGAEAAKTNVVEARQAIYTVLQNELNKSMIARGSEEYAFKVVDAAVSPEKPASPIKILWVVVGMSAGLFISLGIIFLSLALKSDDA
jgi:uncharacterized protein involved in exopolysaccharide biosynthesis